MIVPTKILTDMVIKITSLSRSNVMRITLSIYSGSGAGVDFKDVTIEHFAISKKFGSNTTNDIQLKISLTPKQVAELIKNPSNLLALVVIEYVDPATAEIKYEDPPEVMTYRVLIHDPQSLAKKYGANATDNTDPLADPERGKNAQSETVVYVEMQLITPMEYQMNKAHYHGMLSDTTVEKAIRYVASVFGITKLNLVTPDNTATYKHINIPPESGNFNQIFEFLQHQYGIYLKGLNYYVDNDTLFIYPGFNTRLERSPKLSILKVGMAAHSGAVNYHEMKGSELTVVSNSTMEQKNLSALSAENDGNSQLFMKADSLIDGQVDQKTMKVKDTCVAISNKSDASIQPTSAVAKYSQPTINLFNKASKMAGGDGELITISWNFCRLRLVEPGMPCHYIYDEKDSLVTKQGIVEEVNYIVNRTIRKGSFYIYTATAEFTIRSETDTSSYSG